MTALSGGHIPDFAVSFGTGQFPQETTAPVPSLSWIPGWFRRISHSFIGQLPPSARARHHRINPTFPGPPVELDDASEMPRLSQLTQKQMSQDPAMVAQVDRLRLAMVASFFYPIITSKPVFDRSLGIYHVQLTVVSRWEDDAFISSRLHAHLNEASFWVHGWLYRPVTPLHVRITLARLDDEIQVELQLKDGRRHPISGLPLPASRLRFIQPKYRITPGHRVRTGGKRPRTDGDVLLRSRKCARTETSPLGRTWLSPVGAPSSHSGSVRSRIVGKLRRKNLLSPHGSWFVL